MNTDYTAKITETFYSVNEFCKQIEPQFKKKVIVESTDKCKIKQSFCSTLLLMFQTFVFAWCNVFFAVRVSSFGSSDTCSAPATTRRPFSKVHLPPTSAPNAHA